MTNLIPTYKQGNINLFYDDYNNILPLFKDKSVDLIFCDLPYDKTNNTWDKSIDTKALFQQYKRILTPTGVILLFGVDKMGAELILANSIQYRYKWFWQKDRGTGHLNAKKMPMQNIEEVMVFSPAKIGNFTYNPQMTTGKPSNSVGKAKGKISTNGGNYNEFKKVQTVGDQKYPKQLLYFPRDRTFLYETQKPLALINYFVETHSNVNDVVLDNCMGSNTTGESCKILNRTYYGIESKAKHYFTAVKRVQ